MKKRITAILLCLLTSLPLLAGCASGGDGPAVSSTAAGTAASAATEESVTTEAKPVLPDKDFKGHVYNVLAREKGTTSAGWDTFDVFAEAENGDPINDAVYRRNNRLEEKYNFKVKMTMGAVADHVTTIKTAVLAGDDTYDTALVHTQNCASLVLANVVLDLNKVDYLDFKQPWWDIQVIEDITVSGKTFFALGEINITDNEATWCVLFNKKIRDNYSKTVPDLYELVRDGDWTLPKLTQYSRAVAADLNGDGQMTWDKDMWGIIHQYECANCLFLASGNKTVAKNKDGDLEYQLNTDKAVNTFSIVYDFYAKNTDCAIITDALTVTDKWNVVSRGSFKDDRSLFFMGPIMNIRLIRDMETAFGILPLPKLTDDQDDYFCTMQYNNATAYAIPSSASDPARTGLILEAMAMDSKDTLTAAYYDITLKSKASRDDESGEMLDLIFANRIFDMSFAFSTVGTYAFMQAQVKTETNNFTSAEAAGREAFLAKIVTVMEGIDAAGK